MRKLIKLLIYIFLFIIISQFLVIVDLGIRDLADTDDFKHAMNEIVNNGLWPSFKYYLAITEDYGWSYYNQRVGGYVHFWYMFDFWQLASSVYLTYFFMNYKKIRQRATNADDVLLLVGFCLTACFLIIAIGFLGLWLPKWL